MKVEFRQWVDYTYKITNDDSVIREILEEDYHDMVEPSESNRE